MSLLKFQTVETAFGPIKEVYDQFVKSIGKVPETLQVYSASPNLFQRQLEINSYFRNHKTLGVALQTLIRYLSALACRNGICIRINKEFLKRQGMTEDDIAELQRDASTAPVEDREQALLSFVTRVTANPDSASEADITVLHNLGWTDADIFDAVYVAVMMTTTGPLTRIFKMDI